MRTLKTVIICALALATTIAGVGVTPAQNGTNTERLRRAVAVPGILQHLKEFQEIADDHGDTRSAGTRGYKESVDYVVERLKKAGYKVTRQNFSFNRFEENSPAEFERTSPNPETLHRGRLSLDGVLRQRRRHRAAGGHQRHPHPAVRRVHQRLRGERLPRRHRWLDRPDPARDVHVPAEGRQRGSRRGRRGRDLQRGQ